MIEFQHPWLLAALPAVALAPWLGQRGSLAQWTPRQRRVCTAVRAVILIALVLALAGLRVPWPARDVAVIFALDDSASIGAKARRA